MTNLTDLAAAIEAENDPRAKKLLIREFAAVAWPGLPVWTTLEAPEIQEVGTFTNGCGALVTFMQNGKRKVLLGQAGQHYGKGDQVLYTIPGGFADPSKKKGSTFVPAEKGVPENQYEASAREIEEEFRLANGAPLLKVNPKRLKPLDTNTLLFGSERRIVTSQMYDLNRTEVDEVLAHVELMNSDMAYREAVKTYTINDATGLPEIETLEIFDLDDVADGKVPLLHDDQLSLFQAAKAHYDVVDASPRRREGPTIAYRDKVKDLEQLAAQIAQWRSEGINTIGFTSGVFDILHPGHFSFLNDCQALCDRLVVVVASDRTVGEAKGDDKPIFNEDKRAQSMAAFPTTDAVIISDEQFHETILRAAGFDVMFKGDDYAGKDIKGADLVGRVVLIPCAEKIFNSSSTVIDRIRQGVRDIAPDWARAPAV